MGMLTDFVVAQDTDADAISRSVRPADRWNTFEAKGVDTIKLATLYGVLTAVPYTDDLHSSIEPVGVEDAEGPWVFKLPDAFVGALAAIPESSIPALANAWAQTEELQDDGWTTRDAAELIDSLRAHSSTALSASSTIFLWISL